MTLYRVQPCPDPAPAIIEVFAQFPGASAEEVERQVTVPLEITFAGMPHTTSAAAMPAAEATDANRIQFTGGLLGCDGLGVRRAIKGAFRYLCLNPAGGFAPGIGDAAMWLI